MASQLSLDDSELQKRTIAHYNAYPFDFMTPDDEAEIEKLQPRPFLTFIEGFLHPGMKVAEVGCGPGRGTLYLSKKPVDVTAVDISPASLELARRRAPLVNFVQASNLDLPFDDESFDIVISDGVIHHTPDAHRSFLENVRILRRNGMMYLGVYNRNRYYYYLYTFVGSPLRWLEKSRLGRLLIYTTVFPVYYLAHLVKSRGKRSVRGAINFFYDYFITPRASFHSYDEIVKWGGDAGLRLVTYDPSLGNVHTFVFNKQMPA